VENDQNVAPEDACPLCGERNADRLCWIEDDMVECQMCGLMYKPQRDDAEDDD
jgi:rubredoxin